MIRLPPGPKYILLDARDIARNKERRKAGVPIVRVIETNCAGGAAPPYGVMHSAHNVLTLGPVSLAYSQNEPLLRRIRLAPDLPDEDIQAALYTEGEMLLAESHDEVLIAEEPAAPVEDVPPPAAEPAKAEAPAPTKDKKQK